MSLYLKAINMYLIYYNTKKTKIVIPIDIFMFVPYTSDD